MKICTCHSDGNIGLVIYLHGMAFGIDIDTKNMGWKVAEALDT